MSTTSKVLVALDVPVERAEALITQLSPHVAGFKVGFRQITAGVAPRLLAKIKEVGGRAFYDGKLKDIPNTVADAVAELSQFGVWMFNVHCDGGLEMMEVANATAEKASVPSLILGVTLLTSINYAGLVQMGICPEIASGSPDTDATSQAAEIQRYVGGLARLAQRAGLSGVVASPKETRFIRETTGEEFLIVTPAIRPTGAKADDQKRVGTARQAILDGSNYLVVGRPIYEAENPISAVLALNAEVEQALAEKEQLNLEKGAVAR